MEAGISPETNERHSSGEFKNLWNCQKVIRDWVGNSEWDSYDVLPVLYTSLHRGERRIPGASTAPKLSDVVRTTEAHISGSPSNLLPDSRYVYLLTSKYVTKLDEILKQTPKTMEQAVKDAAFAYYVFDRIHPFPDGNGRIGRMIVKRIFKGTGLKDPVFHDESWYGGGRSHHIEALESVDNTNNLAYLELFLAESLVDMYDPMKEFFKHRELSKVISDSKRRSKIGQSVLLENLWEGFTGLNLYGNTPPVEK